MLYCGTKLGSVFQQSCSSLLAHSSLYNPKCSMVLGGGGLRSTFVPRRRCHRQVDAGRDISRPRVEPFEPAWIDRLWTRHLPFSPLHSNSDCLGIVAIIRGMYDRESQLSLCEPDRDVGRSVRLSLRQMTHLNKLSANKTLLSTPHPHPPLPPPAKEVYFNSHRFFPFFFFSFSCALIYVRAVMQFNPGDMPAAAHRNCLYRRLASQG